MELLIGELALFFSILEDAAPKEGALEIQLYRKVDNGALVLMRRSITDMLSALVDELNGTNHGDVDDAAALQSIKGELLSVIDRIDQRA